MAAARTVNHVLLALTLALAGAGCKGGGDAEKSEIPRLSAEALHDELEEVSGAARLERYRDGVEVTGEVAEVVDLADMGGFRLRLGAGGGARVLVRFADGGERAEASGVEAGARIAVRCRLGGTSRGNVSLRDCALVEL